MKFKVIIPARYDSSRFPGKVLKLIGGKTMLEHVYDNAKNSQADDVFIATDSDIVYEAASKFTKNIYMTSNNNKNGTERVAELSEALNWLPEDLVINLQADMPELKFDNINLLAEKAFNNRGLSTLYYNLADTKLLKDENTVKILVKDKNINFYRHYDGDNIDDIFKHVGIYAYIVKDLILYQALPQSINEKNLSLEQFRFLDNGFKIFAYYASSNPGISIDSINNLNDINGVNN